MGIDRETDIQVVWYRSRGREANRNREIERERDGRSGRQTERQRWTDADRQRESNRLNQKQRERPRYVALVPPPFPFLPNLSPPPPYSDNST